MTRLQILTRVARRTGKNSGTLDSTTKTRLGDFLDESHREILSEVGMESLRHGIVTFASVAGTQQYALPVPSIERINRIWETTNDRKLDLWTLGQLRQVDPDPQQSTPCAWVPVGYEEAHTQPSDASELFVKSTSASDTNTAYIEGYVTGGYYRTASVTMTGSTAVSLSASITSFIRVTKFYLSAAAVGTVTLHEDSGTGTELSRIAIGRSRARFYSLLLEPIPSAAITYTCDITRSVPDMSNDTDEPLIPEDFHDLLVDMTEQKELVKGDDDTRWQKLELHIQKRKRDLSSWVKNNPDYQPTWGGPIEQHARLGAWFPVDQAGRHF